MITFLEYAAIEEIYHRLRVAHDLPASTVFAPTPAITKSSLSNWAELNTLGAGSLFQEQPQIHLVDISGVRVSADLKSFAFDPVDPVYLYHPEEHKLASPERKLLRGAGVDYEKLKKLDLATVRKYAQEYVRTRQLDIDEATLSQVLQVAESLPEITNVLSVVAHPTIDTKEYLQAIRTTEPPKLYMSDFRPGDKRSLDVWRKYVPEDEVQLALSLIHTKLSKYHRDTARLGDVIETDRLIKTNAQASPLTWYRLLLWKAWRQV